MKSMKHLALTVMTLSVVGGTASAQLLTQDRCQNAFGVSSDTAQRRFSWATFCRANPAPDAAGVPRAGTSYLTDASVTDFNTAATNLKPFLFPTYFDFVTFGVWDVPSTSLTPSAVPPTTLPTNPAICVTLPTSTVNAGLCVAGCYVEGTALQFSDGLMGIKAAALSDKADLVTLSPDATLDNLSYTNNRVERYTTDRVESVQTIYTLNMKSGGQLKVTTEHPLLKSDGVIQQAQALKIGDELVLASGKPDAIVGISVGKILGKVYNVKPVTTDYTSNIVVAGGYLNGSLRYQNEFLGTINSLILRRALADQVDHVTN